MNELMIFNNPEFGEVRTLEENGAVLFCGTDAARALRYSEPHKAISRHCPHGTKRTIGVQTGTKADGTPAMQMMEMTFIPESVGLASSRSMIGKRTVPDSFALFALRKGIGYNNPKPLRVACWAPCIVLSVADIHPKKHTPHVCA